jgi:hypothetical protein
MQSLCEGFMVGEYCKPLTFQHVPEVTDACIAGIQFPIESGVFLLGWIQFFREKT